MTIEQLQDLLAQYHLRPDKKFGQNFLMDEDVLEAMVAVADIGPHDAIIEIGPGIGNLTKYLAAKAGVVLAVEKDMRFRELLDDLARRYKNFHIAFADILEFDFLEAFGEILVKFSAYKIVANIPYYVTGKLIQLFLRAKVRPSSITVLVQREVAMNMVALPGAMNLLALSVQLVGIPKIVTHVPAQSFYPAPKVDSAIVHIDIPSRSPYSDFDEKLLFRVAKACFAGKRKQIHNTLVANLRLTAGEVAEVLAQIGIPKTARPQELTVENFIALSKILDKKCK